MTSSPAPAALFIGRLAYDAWGDLTNPAKGFGGDPDAAADEALTSIGYTGHEEFWSVGLVHTYARLYNPAIGRWLSPDPTVPNLYDGQSLNRYSYVLNNPLSALDAMGFCASDETCLSNMTVTACHCIAYTSIIIGITGSGGVGGGTTGNFGLFRINLRHADIKTRTTCAVNARVVGNNGKALGNQLAHLLRGQPYPGAFGILEAPGTADVRIQQWGYSSNSAFAAIAPFISGTVIGSTGQPLESFNGVTDVIGPPSAQTKLLGQFPGVLLLEMNSAPDVSKLGAPEGVAKVKLVINAPFSCSDLSVPPSSGGGS